MSQFACALAMSRWPLSKRYLRMLGWLSIFVESAPSTFRHRLAAHRLQSALLAVDIVRSFARRS